MASRTNVGMFPSASDAGSARQASAPAITLHARNREYSSVMAGSTSPGQRLSRRERKICSRIRKYRLPSLRTSRYPLT